MKTATQILKNKRFILNKMKEMLPDKDCGAIWEDSERRLEKILRSYKELPKGVRTHTDNYIFPSAAIYQALSEEVGKEKAYQVVEEAAIEKTTAMGEKLGKMMRFPGMKDLFLKVWDPLTKKMFGANSGFQNVFYPKKKGEYRMDVIACPYCCYFAELHCPELTKIFCENDDRGYGNLPGLEFLRTGTLGKGADRCDFYMRKT